MKEIYGIFGGRYSDWSVKGFCTTEEKAAAYCERANRTHDKQPRWNNPPDLYYLPLRCLDDGVTCEEYREAHLFEFVRTDGEWEAWRVYGDGRHDGGEVYDDRSPRIQDTRDDDDTITVTVYAAPRSKTEEEIEKIAYDSLYQYLGETIDGTARRN